MSARALIYVQHLLGIGHLARVNRIAGSLHAAGVQTTIVRGGPHVDLPLADGVHVVQLPPVRVTASDMTTLLHADGRLFTDADKAQRRDRLLACLHDISPNILLVEAFPFGRRQMRFELIPMLEAARAMQVPVVASSIRDLLQENRKPGRAEETVDLVNRHFDLVLAHGDAEMTPLSKTFPLADRIAAKTQYTGVVGPDAPARVHRKHKVIVSAGGGTVGARLLETAIRAVPLTPFHQDPWLVLAGPNLPEGEFIRLQKLASEVARTIEVNRSVPDLPAYLAGAEVSISQAGYNTVADVLAAGCAAVLVPFASDGETEQTVRAEGLAASGRAAVAREAELDPAAINSAIRHAIALPKAPAIRFDGGRRSAAILLASLLRKGASFTPFGSSMPTQPSLVAESP